MTLLRLKNLGNDRTGAAALEFALVAPVLIMMLVGGLYTAMLGFTKTSLHFAVEAAARCRSINTTTCNNATATQNFAAGRFINLTGNTATFVASSQTCGNQVTGSVNFGLKSGQGSAISVPLATTACFPT